MILIDIHIILLCIKLSYQKRLDLIRANVESLHNAYKFTTIHHIWNTCGDGTDVAIFSSAINNISKIIFQIIMQPKFKLYMYLHVHSDRIHNNFFVFAAKCWELNIKLKKKRMNIEHLFIRFNVENISMAFDCKKSK